MATPSIGSFTFRALNRTPQTARESLVVLQRPGRDGSTFVKAGTHGAPFAITTVTGLSSASGADTQFASYQAAIGTIVTVTDALSNNWTNNLIIDVQVIDVRALSLDTDSYAAELIVAWQMQQVG